jgi:hypothetical protein
MGEKLAEQLFDVWRIAPAAILLMLVLWSGHKGWWYWDAGVRRLVEQLERERDVWRTIACALLVKQGVALPTEFTTVEGEVPLIKPPPSRRAEDRPDPWKPGS